MSGCSDLRVANSWEFGPVHSGATVPDSNRIPLSGHVAYPDPKLVQDCRLNRGTDSVTGGVKRWGEGGGGCPVSASPPLAGW
jgi:hypothetical protein